MVTSEQISSQVIVIDGADCLTEKRLSPAGE
jgi:hypothetical protein